jgi:hypothetical protein
MTSGGVKRGGMKRTGFIGAVASVAIGAWVVLWAGAANAYQVVQDPLTEANTLQSTISEVTAAGKRIEIINNQIAQLIQIRNTVAALSHGNLAALSQLVPELGALGVTLPLGQDTTGLIRAFSGTAGDLGATALLTQNLLSTNQFYAPTAPDFRAMMMNQAAVSAAASMAAAQTALNANTQRLTQLNTLRNSLGSTPDAKASADATARLAGEQATAQAQTNQLLALLLMQAAQKATVESQEQQMARCAADTLVADAKAAAAAAAGGAVTLITSAPAINCGPPAATATSATAATTSNTTGTFFSGSGAASPVSGDNTALAAMLGTSWGQTAAANATALGVNPTALAATCVLESNCQANPGGTGTISGAFQMSNGTYLQTVSEVTSSDPGLAAQITSKNDPASQSIAASQYLLDGAQSLQANGDTNPSVLDVRGYYQFGPANGAALAAAPDNQLMTQTLTGLSSSTFAANNITGSTTVGQWKASVTNKIGAAASQPVLLGSATQ